MLRDEPDSGTHGTIVNIIWPGGASFCDGFSKDTYFCSKLLLKYLEVDELIIKLNNMALSV